MRWLQSGLWCSPEVWVVLSDCEACGSETTGVMRLRPGHLLALNVIADKQKGFTPSIWYAFLKSYCKRVRLLVTVNISLLQITRSKQWFVCGHFACQRCLTSLRIMALVLWVNSHYYPVCLKGGAHCGSDPLFKWQPIPERWVDEGERGRKSKGANREEDPIYFE